MKPINEQVQLPDPQQQYLVHPVDLPAARKEYLKGWWFGVAATPQVFTALLAGMWVISNNYVTPFLAPLTVLVIGTFSSSRFIRAAWDYIPRKRHDADRRLTGLAVAAAWIKALALLAGLVIFLFWAAAQDFGSSFSSYPLGMGAAVVLIMAFDLAAKWVRGPRATADMLAGLLTFLVVAGAVAGGFALLPDSAARGLPRSGLLAGAATMVVVWLLWLAYSAWQSRRSHR